MTFEQFKEALPYGKTKFSVTVTGMDGKRIIEHVITEDGDYFKNLSDDTVFTRFVRYRRPFLWYRPFRKRNVFIEDSRYVMEIRIMDYMMRKKFNGNFVSFIADIEEKKVLDRYSKSRIYCRRTMISAVTNMFRKNGKVLVFIGRNNYIIERPDDFQYKDNRKTEIVRN